MVTNIGSTDQLLPNDRGEAFIQQFQLVSRGMAARFFFHFCVKKEIGCLGTLDYGMRYIQLWLQVIPILPIQDRQETQTPYKAHVYDRCSASSLVPRPRPKGLGKRLICNYLRFEGNDWYWSERGVTMDCWSSGSVKWRFSAAIVTWWSRGLFFV